MVPKIEMPTPNTTRAQFLILMAIWQSSPRTAVSSKAGVIRDKTAIHMAPESDINKSRSGTNIARPSKNQEKVVMISLRVRS